MSIDAFLESIAAEEGKLSLPPTHITRGSAPETIDALFDLPLLALAAVVIARQSPFRTALLGRSVSALLIEHFTAFDRSAPALEMSITLRRRCAEALAFLEAARLVTVSRDPQRVVTLTLAGKNHIDRANRDAGDLGLLVRRLRRSHARAVARSGDGR